MKGATKYYLVRRSKLVVSPLDDPALAAAAASAADAVVLDVAGLASTNRAAGLAAVPAAAQMLSRLGIDVLVKVDGAVAEESLEECIRPEVRAIVAELNTPEEVTALDRLLTRLEVRRGQNPFSTGIDLILTSANAVLDVQAILASAWRICSLNIDEESLAAEMGVMLGDRVDQLEFARGRIIIAASLFGIQSHGLGFVKGGVSGTETLRARAAMGLKFGHKGAFCSSPEEARLLNEGYSFTSEEIDHAQAVKDAMEDGLRRGIGAVALPGAGGAMVDIIMLTTSRGVLSWVDAVREKEEQRGYSSANRAGSPVAVGVE